MTNNKLLIQRVGLVGVTNLLLGLSTIILLPILTKNISIADYGIWAQISVTISILPGITMLGLPFTMTRFIPSAQTREEIQEMFYSILVIISISSGLACSLIYLFSKSIALTLFDGNITIVEIVSLIAFIECLNSTLNSYFRATQQIKKYSVFTFMQTVLYLFFVIIFVLAGKGILGATIGLLIRSLILFLIMAYFVFNDIGIKLPKFTNLKELVSYGIPTIPINFSRWIVESSDRYVIAIFLGTTAVGYYTPGYSLGNIIYMLIAPISFILPSTLSKYYDEKNITEIKKILDNSLKYFLAIGIPSVFGLSLLSKPILSILSTQEIASNGYLITPFTAVSALFFGIISIFNQVLLLEKKTKITGKVVSLCAALNFGLNFLLIPYIGIIGAAITTLLAYAVNLMFIIYYSSKYLKLKNNLPLMIKSIISSLIMSLIIIDANPNGLSHLILLIATCTVVYFLILFLLGGVDKEEIVFFKEFVKH
ncbi:flippase [Methanosarcina sp. 1.H.A.2.2]|uniref:flippase n=1 Tax=Methanosarcina sp. 1.H.A.2.2 TaxID=1483601 RepID=UPI0006219BD1|nr:flippase [Methanosarcina sp. 1.H.A.2.2]KKH48340.1 polysaccharide biosynthesis protein [Methanosarcina sp. 1.H.A.2.2]